VRSRLRFHSNFRWLAWSAIDWSRDFYFIFKSNFWSPCSIIFLHQRRSVSNPVLKAANKPYSPRAQLPRSASFNQSLGSTFNSCSWRDRKVPHHRDHDCPLNRCLSVGYFLDGDPQIQIVWRGSRKSKKAPALPVCGALVWASKRRKSLSSATEYYSGGRISEYGQWRESS
jgi:hypothetical protein